MISLQLQVNQEPRQPILALGRISLDLQATDYTHVITYTCIHMHNCSQGRSGLPCDFDADLW